MNQENTKQNETAFWKRTDIKLILALLGIAVIWILLSGLFGTAGSEAVVYVEGVEQARYPLAVEDEITVGGTNTFVIRQGQVQMIKAECPDQICVHHKPVSKSGESIVCLPNRVVVEIEGGEKGTGQGSAEVDIVAN